MTKETYTLYKYVKIGPIKERLHIKAFKTPETMLDYLDENDGWSMVRADALTYLRKPYPTKSGVYAAAGGDWHNVKKLDPSILAHV